MPQHRVRQMVRLSIRAVVVAVAVMAAGVALAAPFAINPTAYPPAIVGQQTGSSIDWVQASPFASNKSQVYFHMNGGDPNSLPVYTSTLTPNGGMPTGYSQTSVGVRTVQGGPVAGTDWCKGSALYSQTVMYMAGEGQNNGYYGSIYRVNPTTGAGVTAVDFSTAAISRTDTATTYWGGPNSVAVDRANNKLYVTNTYDASSANEGTSVARFSINPSTYALTLDLVATVYPYAAGAGRNCSYRQIVMPDGWVMTDAHDWNTGTAYVAGFNGLAANQAALQASVTTEASFVFDSAVRGLAFKADATAPSGLGYFYTVGYGNAAYDGVISAYDYQGLGQLGSVVATFDADAALATAGFWTSGNRPRISALDWTQDGALIISTRGGSGGTSPGNAIGFVYAFPVPEPASLALLGVSGLLLLRRRPR